MSVPNYHGFTALFVFSSIAARFFTPQIGGAGATVTTQQGLPFRIVCPATESSSNLINVAAPNTQNDDRHPTRIVQRSLFDLSVGQDNLFKGDRYKWTSR